MKPKFIKRANQWLVSIPKIIKKDKQGQEFHWFSTEQEALDFIKPNKGEVK